MSLKNKLLEEVKEVINSKDEQELCEELADLFEVIKCIAKFYKIAFSEIIKTAEKKVIEKGSFENRIYISSIQIEEDNPNLKYYNNRPNDYPEVE